MLRFQDNYRLETVRRFWELESQKGEGPLKKALHKLRKVHSWPSFVPDRDAYGEGTGDRPCLPIEGSKEVSFDVPPASVEGSEKEKHSVSLKRRSTSSPFTPASERSLPPVTGLSRREKRARREGEYTSRRLAEFRSLRADRLDSYRENPRPGLQSRVDRLANDVRRMEGRLEELPHVELPGQGIPPPRELVPDTVPREHLLPATVRDFIGTGGKGKLGLAPKFCLVRFGCKRPPGHKGHCDISASCLVKMKGHPCSLPIGHSGDHSFVGWLCPECGAPLGRPHNRPDCPVRLARSNARRTG